MPIRLLIADDHSVVRKGIRTLLEDEADIEIVGEAADGQQALAQIAVTHPDVLLLDISMPHLSGIEVTKLVVQQHPGVRVLVFSMHHNPEYILQSVQSGASGYLLKDIAEEELLRAVRAVATGELYYPPSASSVIIRHLVGHRPAPAQTDTATPKPGSVWHRITPREAQILTCLTEGMSGPAIAKRFAISPNTVANQRASIIRKAGVKTTAELISVALKEGKR